MKKESYLPVELLKAMSQKYPKAWEQMEMFHQENGVGNLPSWPEWCYAPMAAALAVASDGRALDSMSPAMMAGFVPAAQAVFALAPWRLSKEVYVIDPDLKDLLFEQDGELDVPDEILLQLPYPCFYVEMPDTYFFSTKIHGFFVALEYDTNNGDRELKPVFLTENMEVFSFSIHIGCKTISESVDIMNSQAAKEMKVSEDARAFMQSIEAKSKTKKFLKQILQVILYILAQNAEITPNSEQMSITKRGKTIKDKYSEIRKWDVGVRIGAAIRQQKTQDAESKQRGDSGSTHQSPRPHMRRGHWHHFWTGSMSKPEERKLILKWLSPMAVAANPDDTPVVFHEVK